MKGWPLVALWHPILEVLPRAELPKVLCGFGDHVCKKFHFHTPHFYPPDGYVKEDDGIRLLRVLIPRHFRIRIRAHQYWVHVIKEALKASFFCGSSIQCKCDWGSGSCAYNVCQPQEKREGAAWSLQRCTEWQNGHKLVSRFCQLAGKCTCVAKQHRLRHTIGALCLFRWEHFCYRNGHVPHALLLAANIKVIECQLGISISRAVFTYDGNSNDLKVSETGGESTRQPVRLF